jgi:ubiquitin-protein ligase
MNPDNTLHEEGINENDQVRVGFQQTAAVNPLDRRDALYRVQNQLQEYVNGHPDFRVAANSTLPTEYDIVFVQAGFGPPREPGGQPTDITEHELSIVLGPEFPITAPRVRWLSEVFHPNVFPTYDCEELRRREIMRGLVCLGTLAESYQPSMDFGELCATLRDIAAYRNYSVVVPAEGDEDPRTGETMLRGDFYDRDAALWAMSFEGQRRILTAGGTPILRKPLPRGRLRYGYDIELV